MKYPLHTVTRPLSEKQAEVVDEALRTGKPIINAHYEATIKRVLSEKNLGITQHASHVEQPKVR